MNRDEAAAVEAGDAHVMFEGVPVAGIFDDGPRVKITDEYRKNRMARSVPDSYFDDVEKAWYVNESDLNARTAVIILRMFPKLALEYQVLNDLQASLVANVRPFDNAAKYGHKIEAPGVRRELAKSSGPDGVSYTMYEFQEIDTGYLKAVMKLHGGAYLGWERGLGKTMASCALIEDLDAKKVLVVAPNTAKGPVWKPELARFLPDWPVEVIPNGKPQREKFLARIREQYADMNDKVIVVIHYEALDIIGDPKARGNKRRTGAGWSKLWEWDLVIADEVHRIKNPTAKMSRAIKKVPSKMRLGLSGSIIENHAEELFSPLQWLFPTRYRRKWNDWNDRFLDFNEGGWGKVFVGIKPDKLGALQDELGVFMAYRRKEDELNLPTRTDQQMYVELTPGQRKVYTDMASSFLSDLPDGTRIKAIDGLSMLTKLRQIATGLDLVGDTVADSSKLDLAIDLIRDAEDEAFVVFSWYKAAAYALADRLKKGGIECYVVTGDVKQQDRTSMIAEFQRGEADKPRVFIGTLSTLGESVNLQRASQAILLDRSWNPATNTQAEDRIYRMGQDKPVTITHIVAKDTVDEYRVMPTLINKEALRGMVLGS